MGEREFLSRLGLSENPFQFTNADEEEHLRSYFIPPPYFESVWGNPDIPQSQVIFAPRGGGKSAQRRMIEYQAQAEDVFAITYDRFEHLSDTNLQRLGVDYHLRNLIQLGLLGFLLELHGRGIHAPAFTGAEREQISGLCGRYLSNITRMDALEALKSLKTLSSKARELIRDWSGPLNALISATLSSQGLGSVSMGSPAHQAQTEGAVEGPTKAHLEIVRDLIKSIGFKSILVLTDKVDETPQTGNNAEDSFLLMKPLLRDLELLQLRGIGFKFFLWDKLEPYYREFARPDRIQQFTLSWSRDDINNMLSRRLAAFSEELVTNLGQLTDGKLAEALQFTVVLFASGSPRDMIRACQDILSEQLQLDAEAQKIGGLAIVQGILKFSTRRAQELVPDQILRELIKVGRLDFTTNYVANDVFKIEVNSARNKINQWKQVGAVEKVGELHTGGRPIHHYAVSDVRIAKTMLPQLGLVEFFEKKIHFCEKCAALMLRDWDLALTQTCHLCGTEQRKKSP